MKMKNLTLLVLVIATHTCFAAEKKPSKVLPKSVELPSYASQDFNASVEKLPANFTGNDCELLGEKLRGMDLSKGEFETSAAYKARIDSLGDTPLVGTLLIGSAVAFVPEDSAYSTYDADTSTMRLRLPAETANVRVGTNYVASAALKERETSAESYSASNAYGKTVNVRKAFYKTCAVGFTNIDQIRDRRQFLRDIAFNIDPSEAKAIGKNIRIAYVGKLAAPYYAKYSRYLEPKIDSPYEAFWTGDTVLINLSQLIVFDKISGKILHHASM